MDCVEGRQRRGALLNDGQTIGRNEQLRQQTRPQWQLAASTQLPAASTILNRPLPTVPIIGTEQHNHRPTSREDKLVASLSDNSNGLSPQACNYAKGNCHCRKSNIHATVRRHLVGGGRRGNVALDISSCQGRRRRSSTSLVGGAYSTLRMHPPLPVLVVVVVLLVAVLGCASGAANSPQSALWEPVMRRKQVPPCEDCLAIPLVAIMGRRQVNGFIIGPRSVSSTAAAAAALGHTTTTTTKQRHEKQEPAALHEGQSYAHKQEQHHHHHHHHWNGQSYMENNNIKQIATEKHPLEPHSDDKCPMTGPVTVCDQIRSYPAEIILRRLSNAKQRLSESYFTFDSFFSDERDHLSEPFREETSRRISPTATTNSSLMPLPRSKQAAMVGAPWVDLEYNDRLHVHRLERWKEQRADGKQEELHHYHPLAGTNPISGSSSSSSLSHGDSNVNIDTPSTSSVYHASNGSQYNEPTTRGHASGEWSSSPSAPPPTRGMDTLGVAQTSARRPRMQLAAKNDSTNHVGPASTGHTLNSLTTTENNFEQISSGGHHHQLNSRAGHGGARPWRPTTPNGDAELHNHRKPTDEFLQLVEQQAVTLADGGGGGHSQQQLLPSGRPESELAGSKNNYARKEPPAPESTGSGDSAGQYKDENDDYDKRERSPTLISRSSPIDVDRIVQRHQRQRQMVAAGANVRSDHNHGFGGATDCGSASISGDEAAPAFSNVNVDSITTTTDRRLLANKLHQANDGQRGRRAKRQLAAGREPMQPPISEGATDPTDQPIQPEPFCRAKSIYISPRAAMNDKKQWKYVVNAADRDPRIKQIIRVDVCEDPFGPCSDRVVLPLGFTSQCKQKYAKKKLLALDAQSGFLEVDTFFIPSCCVCQLVRDTRPPQENPDDTNNELQPPAESMKDISGGEQPAAMLEATTNMNEAVTPTAPERLILAPVNNNNNNGN